MDKFKSGTVPLLIATDVAARGLDIPDVEVRGLARRVGSTVVRLVRTGLMWNDFRECTAAPVRFDPYRLVVLS